MLEIFKSKKRLSAEVEDLKKQLEEKNQLLKEMADATLILFDRMDANRKLIMDEIGLSKARGNLSFWFKGILLLYLYAKGGQAEIDEKFVRALNDKYDFEYDAATKKYRIKGFNLN